ncbi:hypothetical protein F935_01569 [Acinetobacter calcoaceticus ANC 3811]|uniref:Helix-turn-helix domain-containing protein n=1 Tax=Acinetobacter calcoaceticus ANC 3811 TaxID=1217690 RepID=R8Y414_ACICA|nr:hypothetical protein [Acinetobacter calcoaceticus]EOQ63939.1 hypothetical protein F935_01569 [Acinetobacter calcoaceticus ANC 3811]
MGALKLRPEEKLQQLIDSGASLVSTNDAAKVLGYKPNTLRVWASRGCGDLTPVMTKKGARWRLTDLRNLVGA